MKRLLAGDTRREDGTKDTFWSQEVESKVDLLPHQRLNRTYTVSGYGKRIPTIHKVLFNNKWRRVYVCIYSNVGTCYIGKLNAVGENIYVR